MGRKKESSASGLVEGQNKASKPTIPETILKDYMDVIQLQARERDGLLGSFDANGDYKISSQNIIDLLKNASKKFEEKVDNVVYLSAKKDDFVLNFKIEFDIKPDFCEANLFLIEVEHGLEQDKKLVTHLDNYLSIYDARFRDDVYKLWKVWVEEDIYDKNDELFEIIRSMHEQYLFSLELSEILAQLYVLRMLKHLDGCGPVGEKTKAEYKLYMEKMSNKDPAFSQSYVRAKLVLDKVMKENKAFELVEKSQEGKTILAGYAVPIQRIKGKSRPQVKEIIKPAEKAEKKEEKAKPKAKAKSKSKPAAPIKTAKFDFGKCFKGGSGGGGGAKKTEKAQVKVVVPTPIPVQQTERKVPPTSVQPPKGTPQKKEEITLRLNGEEMKLSGEQAKKVLDMIPGFKKKGQQKEYKQQGDASPEKFVKRAIKNTEMIVEQTKNKEEIIKK